MTTIFLDQSAALDKQLSLMVGLPPVAWEGRKYTPVLDTLYLQPSNQPAETLAETNEDKTSGVYAIDIFAPAGNGKNESVAMCDKLANWFKHGTELTYNGVSVVTENVHRDDGRNTAEGWYNVTILIDYYSFTARR